MSGAATSKSKIGGEEGFRLPDKKPTAHEESALAVPGSYPLRLLLGNFPLFPGRELDQPPLLGGGIGRCSFRNFFRRAFCKEGKKERERKISCLDS